MSGIFISYRREDSQAIAGRLCDRLVQSFGHDQVFRDITSIDPGSRFAQVIAEKIGSCDALVALIGKNWLEAQDSQGRRRLDSPNDFVKAEIAEAIAQNKLIIPVLIEGASMPSRDGLPREIRDLASLNALAIADSRFDFDVGRLVSEIGKVRPLKQSESESMDLLTRIRNWLYRRARIGLVVITCAGIWWQWGHIKQLPGVERLVNYMVGYGLDIPPPDSQDKHALDIYLKCDRGFAGFCTTLGNMYLAGYGGVMKDTWKATSLYRHGCEGGSARGCTSLGSMYKTGRGGVAQDEAKAVSLYRQGCDEGDAVGCTNLGSMYRTGKGVAQDEAKAVSLYRQGCDGGDSRGCDLANKP